MAQTRLTLIVIGTVVQVWFVCLMLTIELGSADTIHHEPCYEAESAKIGGKIVYVNMTGCVESKSTPTKCVLQRGTKFGLDIVFVPYKNYQNLQFKLIVKTWIPFTLPTIDQDPCQKYSQCPLVAGDYNHLKITERIISTNLPQTNDVKMMAQLTESVTNTVVACGIANIAII